MMRWLWYSWVLVVAVLAVCVEFDAMSRRDHTFAAYVPEPFSNYAQAHIAADALAGQDPARALDEARKLVRRRPIPSDSLFILSSAYALTGSDEASNKALFLGAGRGWRHPVIEQIMVSTALQNADLNGATAHLLALWSIDFDGPARDALMHDILTVPGGAQAFGKLVATSHFAQNGVLRGAFKVAAQPDAARMTQAAIAAGARFDCRLLQAQQAEMRRHGDGLLATSIEDPRCLSGATVD